MLKSRKIPIVIYLLGSFLLLISSGAKAINLGEIEVQSRLNMPLQAVIPISASTSELATLEIALASKNAFKRFGIAETDHLKTLQFTLVNTGSSHHIKVTSTKTIREPMLEFVLLLKWGRGNVLKDFTAFLSP